MSSSLILHSQHVTSQLLASSLDCKTNVPKQCNILFKILTCTVSMNVVPFQAASFFFFADVIE